MSVINEVPSEQLYNLDNQMHQFTSQEESLDVSKST